MPRAQKRRADEARGKDVRDVFDLVQLSDLGREHRETERIMEVEWSGWLLRRCSIVERKCGRVPVERGERKAAYLELLVLLQLK